MTGVGLRAFPLPGPGTASGVAGLVGLPDPFAVLGGVTAGVAGGVWRSAMVGVWSAGLWLQRLAFQVEDALATPDLTAGGPMRTIVATTLWLGGSVAVLLFVVQLGLILVRRDGASLGRLILGLVQFGFVWVGFLALADGAVTAAGGLTRGILQATVRVNALAAYDWTGSWPRDATDTVSATVLGITSLLLVIPAAFFGLLIALVRDAALVVLVATAPISAAGALSEGTRTWLWKTLRWFIAAVLIAPSTALVLGIGIGLSRGVVEGAGNAQVAAIGSAVVGAMLVLVGSCSPLVLFRLLAFVDPGTVSGAALRQSWLDAGGLAGLTGQSQARGGASTGAASASDGSGRAAGEAGAEATTGSRLAAALGPLGQGVAATVGVATRAVDIASDVLGSAGVGSPGYGLTPADERAIRAGRSRSGGSWGDPGGSPGSGDPGGGPGVGGPAGGEPAGGGPAGGAPAGGGPAGGGPGGGQVSAGPDAELPGPGAGGPDAGGSGAAAGDPGGSGGAGGTGAGDPAAGDPAAGGAAAGGAAAGGAGTGGAQAGGSAAAGAEAAAVLA